MNARKILCLVLACLMLTLAACGGSAKAENEMYYSDQSAAEAPEYGFATSETIASPQGSNSSAALPANRKLIRTIHIQAETEDLDSLQEEINSRISQLGGYIQSKNLHNGSAYASYRTRSMSMTIRIPADQADAFVQYCILLRGYRRCDASVCGYGKSCESPGDRAGSAAGAA